MDCLLACLFVLFWYDYRLLACGLGHVCSYLDTLHDPVVLCFIYILTNE